VVLSLTRRSGGFDWMPGTPSGRTPSGRLSVRELRAEMGYPCYGCGKPMDHLCADLFTCVDCGIIISEALLLEKLRNPEQPPEEAETPR